MLKEIQFSTLTGAGTVALVDASLPITLSTLAGPMPVDVDLPISVRVKMTVTGSVRIDSSVYKFSPSGDLFP